MLRVLVTGGAGFIGSHLTKSLLTNGFDVTILDNLSNSTREQVLTLKKMGADFVRGDIGNYTFLSKKVTRFEVVVHLAAKINVPESTMYPELYHNVNVTGTLNLLRACVKNNVKNLIAASSAAVYGNPKILPIREDSKTIPVSPYGATKLSIEHYLSAFSNSYNMNAISLRFFNIYGEGQSVEYAGVIKKFLDKIHSSRSLVVYGDGKNTRDFVSIDDVVHSIMSSIKRIGGKKGDVYNIAGGMSVSINDLARLMISLSGKRLKIIHKEPLKSDIRHSRASISLARKDLGYVPHVSLQKGLEKLMNLY